MALSSSQLFILYITGMSQPMSLATLTYAMGEITKQIEEVKTLLNDFIKAANSNYASKEEVSCIKELSDRVARLEQWKRKMIGMWIVVGTISSVIVGFLINILANKR